MISRVEHSSLLCQDVNYGIKRFYKIGLKSLTRVQVCQINLILILPILLTEDDMYSFCLAVIS
jgi:hypothetical protein